MTVTRFTAQCADDLSFKLWSLLFLALPSCGSSDGSINGNLGKGSFTYECVSVDDPACPKSSSISVNVNPTSPSTFPAAVASGAHFKVAYQPFNPSTGGNPSLRPVAPEYLDSLSADGALTALKPGVDGLVARSSVDGLVYDFLYIQALPISALGVTNSDGSPVPGTVAMTLGSSTSYAANALGPHNEKLAGAVDYTWSSSNPSVVKIEQGNPTAHVDLDALTSGNAIIQVTQGTTTVSIPITVTP